MMEDKLSRMIEISVNGAVIGYVRAHEYDSDDVITERVDEWCKNSVEWEEV